MAGNSNSGRRRGTSYRRRTNDEIARDERAEANRAAAEAAQVQQRRDRDFFVPRRIQAQQHQQPQPQPHPPPPPPPPNTIDRDYSDPTPEDPLPGVDMSRVPELLRRQIGQVMHELRAIMKGGNTGGTYQYIKTRSSTGWSVPIEVD